MRLFHKLAVIEHAEVEWFVDDDLVAEVFVGSRSSVLKMSRWVRRVYDAHLLFIARREIVCNSTLIFSPALLPPFSRLSCSSSAGILG